MAKIVTPGLESAMTPVEPGTYSAQITGVRTHTREDTGEENLIVDWMILDDGPFSGRSVSQWFNLSNEVSVQMLGQLLKALEIEINDDAFDSEDLEGREAQIVVSHYETPDGETRASVKRVLKS